MEPDNPLLDDFILSLAQKRQPKVCFVPTASGDSDKYVARFYCAFGSSRCSPSHLPLFLGHLLELANFLCDQDVIYVGGGNTANMLAVWRVQAMDKALAAAWRKGVVLCGVSAGAMCWFEGSLTDSFGSRLAPLRDGLSFSQGGVLPPLGWRAGAAARSASRAPAGAFRQPSPMMASLRISSVHGLWWRFLRGQIRALTGFDSSIGN